MRFGVITWMALLYGAIWGGLWMTLTGLLLMLVSGLIAVPTIGMAALVGVVTGGAVIFFPVFQHSWRPQILLIVGVAVGLLLVTAGSPFSTPLSQKPLYQFAALFIWAALTAFANAMP